MVPSSYYSYDLTKYQNDRRKLSQFLEYRQQFEKSQQVRIQAKIKEQEDETNGTAAIDNITDEIEAFNSDDELS